MSLVDIPDVPLRQIFRYLDIKTVGLMTCTSSSIHNFIVNNNVLCGFHKNIHKLTIKVMGNENDEFPENLDENAIEVRVEVNRRTTKLFRFLPDPSGEMSKEMKMSEEEEEELCIIPPLPSHYFLYWLGIFLSNSAIDSIQLEEFCLNEVEMERLESFVKGRKTKTGMVFLSEYFNRVTWERELLLRFLKMMNVTRLDVDINFMRVKEVPPEKLIGDFIRSHGIVCDGHRFVRSFRSPLTDSFDGLDKIFFDEDQKRLEYGQIKKELHDWARGRTETLCVKVDVSGPYRNVLTFLEDLDWPSDLPSEVSEEENWIYLTNIEGNRCFIQQCSWFGLPHNDLGLPFINMWHFCPSS